MTSTVYNSYLRHLLSGTIDLQNDQIRVSLVSGTYTPNASTHSTYTDISAHEVVDALATKAYLSGGTLLAGKTIVASSNQAVFDANDVSWSPATITNASGAVVWCSGTGAINGQRPLICFVSLGALQSSTNGTFQIVWNNTNGIFRVAGA